MNEGYIPKIIHYCWFGGNPLPELAEKCIESWKKYCPSYKIIQWDESNFDMGCCDYVREAYESKMWAFVSDYARFKILYDQGGVYFDTDVELLKPIDDIVKKGAFMGMEKASIAKVAPGLGLAATPGMPLYKEILDDYHKSHFIGNENFTVVTRVTGILENYGHPWDQGKCNVAGVNIYPPEYFCPLDFDTGKMTITENTHAIHYYTASWHNEIQKKITNIKRRFANHPYIAKCFTMPLYFIDILRRAGFCGFVKFAIKKFYNVFVPQKNKNNRQSGD